MNQYYKCLYFLKEALDNAPLLNTITQGTDIIDNQKKNIFPLAHINIQSSSIQDGQVLIGDGTNAAQMELVMWKAPARVE